MRMWKVEHVFRRVILRTNMNAAVQTEEMDRRGRTKTKTTARKVKETCQIASSLALR